MARYINADTFIADMETMLLPKLVEQYGEVEAICGLHFSYRDCISNIECQSSADVVEVVRCKDCKHFPAGTNRDDLVFPDEICPCYCEDFWYSWKPNDDFYCGKGERKDD